MRSLDETALICDFAEIYHIYDYRSLPIQLAATLAAGLGINTRIGSKILGYTVDRKTYLLELISDRLTNLLWMLTEDGQSGKSAPEVISNKYIIAEEEKETESEYQEFDSVEDYEKARAKIMKGD